MEKKKVMVFIDWYLPGFKAGGPIRSVRNIAITFSKEIDFYIVTSDRDFGDVQAYPSIQLDQWLYFDKEKVIYLSSKNQNQNNYINLIEEIEPDTIYLNSLFSLKFSILPLQV